MAISAQQFLLHKQKVIAAITGQTPRDQWWEMSPISRTLLLAVITARYKDRYYNADGYLILGWRRLALEVFGRDIGTSLRSCALYHDMLEIKVVLGGLNRSRLVVTPQVQQILEDLANCDGVFDPSH